jgi:DNA repair protein SbcC/Rad50
MILKSVKLNNIRTYESELIDFTEGSTLLSGDIGSGKSSVLLCIEFGLFGLQRGEISGIDLLRHGATEGSVELSFDDNGSKITLGRYLKRTKKGITQEAGFIDINGSRNEKSPNDLRALVLELLGYPQEYVNKNPIMFRYTVYTPQDEMKKILFADSEERLRIIRKIFDIDKYGRIRENASDIVLKELRSLKRECQVKFSDLEQKFNEKKDKGSARDCTY